MSRPDRVPTVAVDFAPRRRGSRRRPLAVLALVILTLAVLAIAVSQLLLR